MPNLPPWPLKMDSSFTQPIETLLGFQDCTGAIHPRRDKRSPFTVHRSPFIAHRSPFTVRPGGGAKQAGSIALVLVLEATRFAVHRSGLGFGVRGSAF